MSRPAGIDRLINLRHSLLDPHADFVPVIETCTDARRYRASPQAQHRLAGLPAMEECRPLVETFAAEA